MVLQTLSVTISQGCPLAKTDTRKAIFKMELWLIDDMRASHYWKFVYLWAFRIVCGLSFLWWGYMHVCPCWGMEICKCCRGKHDDDLSAQHNKVGMHHYLLTWRHMSHEATTLIEHSNSWNLQMTERAKAVRAQLTKVDGEPWFWFVIDSHQIRTRHILSLLFFLPSAHSVNNKCSSPINIMPSEVSHVELTIWWHSFQAHYWQTLQTCYKLTKHSYPHAWITVCVRSGWWVTLTPSAEAIHP